MAVKATTKEAAKAVAATLAESNTRHTIYFATTTITKLKTTA
jgi:hypothetical protein